MEKINVAELLKDCPKGMELDCTIYANVTLEYVTKSKSLPICVRIQNKGTMFLSRYGQVYEDNNCKCVIFPKGKTSWEGFVPPCKFRDGDVVATTSGAWIGITTGGESGELIPTYCVIKGNGTFEAYTDVKKTWCFSRFATKEERQKLFDEIKAHGYTWNSKTKTLEELTQPNFKVGDWVTDGVSTCQIHSIDDTQYWYSENCILGSIESVDKRYHLWTIQDAKDGDMLFYDSGWMCIFNRIHGIWYSSYCFITSEGEFCTGYEEHAVDAKINGKAHPATKEQCTFLLQKIREADYKWNAEIKTLEKLVEPIFKVGNRIRHKEETTWTCVIKRIDDRYWVYGHPTCYTIPFGEQDEYELVPNKFDINTLKPFDKVLVRDSDKDIWCASIFSHTWKDKYFCVGAWHNQCISYEAHKELLGTTNNPKEHGSD